MQQQTLTPSPKSLALAVALATIASISFGQSAEAQLYSAPPDKHGDGVGSASTQGSAQLPLWEVGVFGTGLMQQAYPGSSQQVNRALVLPFFIYRGQYLRADRGSVGVRAIKTDTMGNRTRPGGLAVGTGAGYSPRLTSPPAPAAAVARIRSMSSEPPPSLDTDVRNLRELASDTNLTAPSGEPLQRVGHDWLLHIGEKASFYVRAESVRAMHGMLHYIVGRRKPRGTDTEEVLGGAFGVGHDP